MISTEHKMVTEIDIEYFINNSGYSQIIDVRSPKEYEKGHIPGAVNIPLFDNSERETIGTIYKCYGEEKAFTDGLKIAGVKLADIVNKAKESLDKKDLMVYCWRGGMRSKSMAWLFDTAGFKTAYLKGGYKSYRTYARKNFGIEARLIILGGYTGSGKTEILQYFEKAGRQILDIENIANHKGSVFGNIGKTLQPTNEQFENNIFEKWRNFDFDKPVWIEDESFHIGSVYIPEPLYKQMIDSEIIFISLPKEERIKRLINEYSNVDKQILFNALSDIEKKLGGDNYKSILAFLQNNEYYNVVNKLLDYYDKTYDYMLLKRKKEKIHCLSFDNMNIIEIAKDILNKFDFIKKQLP